MEVWLAWGFLLSSDVVEISMNHLPSILVWLNNDGSPVGFSDQIFFHYYSSNWWNSNIIKSVSTENLNSFDLTSAYKQHSFFLLLPKMKMQYNHTDFLVNTYGSNWNKSVYVCPFIRIYFHSTLNSNLSFTNLT